MWHTNLDLSQEEAVAKQLFQANDRNLIVSVSSLNTKYRVICFLKAYFCNSPNYY